MGKFHDCYSFNENFSSTTGFLIVSLLPTITFLCLVALTIKKYSKSIIRMNKCLLISWTVEAVYRFALTLMNYFGVTKSFAELYELPTLLALILYAMSFINSLVSIVVFFKLKSMQIYLDSDNMTPG